MQIKKTPEAPSTPLASTKKKSPDAGKATEQASQQQASKKSAATKKTSSPKDTMPKDDAKIRQSQGNSTRAPRSYAMVISSYENVARTNDLDSDIASQLGDTLQRRLDHLNRQTLRALEDLPEYKKLEIENIKEFGDEIADMLTDDETSLKAFALLKHPEFADLMEPKESIHRTFADMMKDHGDEKLMFGALDLVDTLTPQKKTSTPPGINIRA